MSVQGGGVSMLQQQVCGETSRGDNSVAQSGESQRNPWTNRSSNILEREGTRRDDVQGRYIGKGGLNREGNKMMSGGASNLTCNKCKDTRHTTKDCKLDHCAVCGKRNHVTDDCTWLRQMKPFPKFLEYAPRVL